MNPVLLLTGCLFLAGCKSSSPTGNLNKATAEYQAQHYQAAHEQATAALKDATGLQREHAAYVAGLSAYRMNRLDDAERHLLIASRSADATVAGDAKAMLGMIRMDQRRPREAAALYTDASTLLTGEDAKQAAYHAGMAYAEARDSVAAKRWLAVAEKSATVATASPSKKQTTSDASTASRVTGSSKNSSSGVATSFALQVGAFRDKDRAQHAARDANTLAGAAGLVTSRIISTRDARGQALHLVQLGNFPSREAAAAARAKLGRLDYIVAAVPVSSTLAAR